MDAVIKSIQDEIKKRASEENIDFFKLRTLLKTLEDIKAMNVTSVSQIPIMGFTPQQNNIPAYPAYPARNETNMMFDEIREAIHENSKPRYPTAIPLSTHISWYNFLVQASKTASDNSTMFRQKININNTKSKLLEAILKDIEEEISVKKDDIKNPEIPEIEGGVNQ